MTSPPSTAHKPEIRLSIADFVRLSLLTPKEIADKTEVTRILAVEDADQPQSASLTEYESATSPKGMRSTYNLAAAEERQIDTLPPEYTAEASIYNTLPYDIKGVFLPRVVEVPVRTYFKLGVSFKERDENSKLLTSDSRTVMALQDPENPDEFIVAHAFQKASEHASHKERAIIVQDVLRVMDIVGRRFEQIRDNLEVAKTDVRLGVQPA
jgi:hypothetical protein